MNYPTILILDPGYTTGYAVFKLEDNIHSIKETGKFTKWKNLPRLIEQYSPDLIIYEKIVVHRGNFDTVGLLVTGVILYLAELNMILTKEQIPTAMVPAYQWARQYLVRYDSDHIKDAIAHGLSFLGPSKVNPLYVNKEYQNARN